MIKPTLLVLVALLALASACASEPQNTPAPIPELTPTLGKTAGGGCLANTPERIQPSTLVKKVTMAEGVQGSNEPRNPTAIFAPNSPFFAILGIESAPAKTKFKAVWYATDTKGVAPCNARIGDSEQEAEGVANIVFTTKPEGAWAAGAYRVELFVNNTLSHIVNFVVR